MEIFKGFLKDFQGFSRDFQEIFNRFIWIRLDRLRLVGIRSDRFGFAWIGSIRYPFLQDSLSQSRKKPVSIKCYAVKNAVNRKR